MKFTLVSTFASILAIASGVCAAGPVAPVPKPPKAPGLTYLYTVNITGGEAAIVGQGPRGFRLVVPILRGSFAGPKLKGKSPPQTPSLSQMKRLNREQEPSSPLAVTGRCSTPIALREHSTELSSRTSARRSRRMTAITSKSLRQARRNRMARLMSVLRTRLEVRSTTGSTRSSPSASCG